MHPCLHLLFSLVDKTISATAGRPFVSFTAGHNPGHREGCTTWTMKGSGNGRKLQVVFVGGVSINDGVRLAGNRKFPEITETYARTFRHLKSLRGEVFLSQHGAQHNPSSTTCSMFPPS